MSTYWRESFSKNGIKYEYETVEEYGYVNGSYQRLNSERTGRVRIQVGGNYGNCLYTTKDGGNLVYRAIKSESPVSHLSIGHDTFILLDKMREVLDQANIDYSIACC